MTAPMLMDCPTEETLAAYVDDRLDPATRQTVTEHLASHGECRELVLMATDYQMSERPAKVVRPFGWVAAAAGLAAAAVIAMFALRPVFVFGPQFDEVIAASHGLKYRPGPGRVGGGIAYKKMTPTNRGGSAESDEASKADLYAITAETKDTHALGVATLLTAADLQGLRDAVETLDSAHAGARGEKRDAIALDLAAALLAYGRWTGDAAAAERALQLSDDLWKRTQAPEAAWNRAAALEELGRKNDAIRAWDHYLKLDPASSWSAEARKRKSDLNADP